MLNKLRIIVFFGLFFSEPVIAKSSQSSLMVHFGEAFGMNNYRLNYESVDLGYDGRGGGLYFGKRLWKSSLYAGTGLWLGSGDGGIYGSLGKSWTFFEVLATSVEFWGVGTVQGTTYAVANLGIGVAW
jgi:hypothetical protein